MLERAARNLGAIPWYAVYKAGVSVEIADTAGNVHVDVNHFGIETGSDLFPYDTIEEGHDAAGSGGRLIISQGSYSELVRLTNAVVLIPKNGTVTLGR